MDGISAEWSKNMTFIRDRKELKTGYQEVAPWSPKLDLQCDFVMAYGIDDTLEQRIKVFREKGYRVHLMTGCAWGCYQDYLNGTWDGREHYDERQMDRDGKPIMHGVDTPYMVPTMDFVRYLQEKLCALACGDIEAIFMEEPEFWDAGGYSAAFCREYEAYYKEPWQPPHKDATAYSRCAQLKVYLYARLVDHLSREVKAYAREHCGKEIGFYVATHSLVNYTQWKIMSPGSRMVDMEAVDGFIAQVWSGTSGTGNVYNGRYKSRTFETAYFEYASMQEMNYGTDRKMWFLHDPVEDFPENGWETYRKKYIKTLTASLFCTGVDRYEVCPWPNRVYNGRYPKKLGMANGMIPTDDMEGAKDIPAEYATMLSAMIQTLCTMEREPDAAVQRVGILVSDSALCGRGLPDDTFKCGAGTQAGVNISAAGQKNGNQMIEALNNQIVALRETEEEHSLYGSIAEDEGLYNAYAAGCTYPAFFGLAMPLLKHGLLVRPMYAEHVKRYENYLAKCRYLVVSYEGIKPESPSFHAALTDWVNHGGNLLYVGDGRDIFHAASAWWNKEGRDYRNPAEHLFEMLGLSRTPEEGTYPVGEGMVSILHTSPAHHTFSPHQADRYRDFVKQALFNGGYVWKETNTIRLSRGPYRIVAVMDESISENAYTEPGLYSDLLSDGFPVTEQIAVPVGSEGLFFDYRAVEHEDFCVIATAARIEKLTCEDGVYHVWEKAADHIHVYTRIRMPKEPKCVRALDEDENPVEITSAWDEKSRTVLLSYASCDKLVKLSMHLA